MRILVADDEYGTRMALQALLADEYELVFANDGLEAWSILEQDDAPSLALVDWMMPGMDGTEVCRKVRERGDSRYVYIVMLTAKEHRDDLVAGLDAGADDYLRKPFHPEELRARLRAGERILKLERELRVRATHDHLTGLLNRGATLEILKRELARAARKNEIVGIILGDLDNFKEVNDTYGHLIGDEVLKEAAHRLGKRLRSYDVLGRYGGEEFLVVLPRCDEDCAQAIADRMCNSVAAAPVTTKGGDIWITVSLGFALTGRADPMQMEDLLTAADDALYRAKREGRNRAISDGAAGRKRRNERGLEQGSSGLPSEST